MDGLSDFTRRLVEGRLEKTAVSRNGKTLYVYEPVSQWDVWMAAAEIAEQTGRDPRALADIAVGYSKALTAMTPAAREAAATQARNGTLMFYGNMLGQEPVTPLGQRRYRESLMFESYARDGEFGEFLRALSGAAELSTKIVKTEKSDVGKTIMKRIRELDTETPAWGKSPELYARDDESAKFLRAPSGTVESSTKIVKTDELDVGERMMKRIRELDAENPAWGKSITTWMNKTRVVDNGFRERPTGLAHTVVGRRGAITTGPAGDALENVDFSTAQPWGFMANYFLGPAMKEVKFDPVGYAHAAYAAARADILNAGTNIKDLLEKAMYSALPMRTTVGGVLFTRIDDIQGLGYTLFKRVYQTWFWPYGVDQYIRVRIPRENNDPIDGNVFYNYEERRKIEQKFGRAYYGNTGLIDDADSNKMHMDTVVTMFAVYSSRIKAIYTRTGNDKFYTYFMAVACACAQVLVPLGISELSDLFTGHGKVFEMLDTYGEGNVIRALPRANISHDFGMTLVQHEEIYNTRRAVIQHIALAILGNVCVTSEANLLYLYKILAEPGYSFAETRDASVPKLHATDMWNNSDAPRWVMMLSECLVLTNPMAYFSTPLPDTGFRTLINQLRRGLVKTVYPSKMGDLHVFSIPGNTLPMLPDSPDIFVPVLRLSARHAVGDTYMAQAVDDITKTISGRYPCIENTLMAAASRVMAYQAGSVMPMAYFGADVDYMSTSEYEKPGTFTTMWSYVNAAQRQIGDNSWTNAAIYNVARFTLYADSAFRATTVANSPPTMSAEEADTHGKRFRQFVAKSIRIENLRQLYAAEKSKDRSYVSYLTTPRGFDYEDSTFLNDVGVKSEIPGQKIIDDKLKKTRTTLNNLFKVDQSEVDTIGASLKENELSQPLGNLSEKEIKGEIKKDIEEIDKMGNTIETESLNMYGARIQALDEAVMRETIYSNALDVVFNRSIEYSSVFFMFGQSSISKQLYGTTHSRNTLVDLTSSTIGAAEIIGGTDIGQLALSGIAEYLPYGSTLVNVTDVVESMERRADILMATMRNTVMATAEKLNIDDKTRNRLDGLLTVATGLKIAKGALFIGLGFLEATCGKSATALIKTWMNAAKQRLPFARGEMSYTMSQLLITLQRHFPAAIAMTAATTMAGAGLLTMGIAPAALLTVGALAGGRAWIYGDKDPEAETTWIEQGLKTAEAMLGGGMTLASHFSQQYMKYQIFAVSAMTVSSTLGGLVWRTGASGAIEGIAQSGMVDSTGPLVAAARWVYNNAFVLAGVSTVTPYIAIGVIALGHRLLGDARRETWPVLKHALWLVDTVGCRAFNGLFWWVSAAGTMSNILGGMWEKGIWNFDSILTKVVLRFSLSWLSEDTQKAIHDQLVKFEKWHQSGQAIANTFTVSTKKTHDMVLAAANETSTAATKTGGKARRVQPGTAARRTAAGPTPETAPAKRRKYWTKEMRRVYRDPLHTIFRDALVWTVYSNAAEERARKNGKQFLETAVQRDAQTIQWILGLCGEQVNEAAHLITEFRDRLGLPDMSLTK